MLMNREIFALDLSVEATSASYPVRRLAMRYLGKLAMRSKTLKPENPVQILVDPYQ